MRAELRRVVDLLNSGWNGAHAVVVGDVMMDRYVFGDVERISPEAPVPVVRQSLVEEWPGGAANVAMNLASLGASVTLAGLAGADPEQERLESMLVESGIEPCLTGIPGVPTVTKLRILSGGQQMLRVDSEPPRLDSSAAHARLSEAAFRALQSASVLILSDYAKGALTEELCQILVAEARRLKVPVLVDPKHRDLTRYRGATSICPNRAELAAATGEPAADLDRLLSSGQRLVPQLDMEFMVVTLGGKGIAVLRRDSRWRSPAIVRQVHDVSGAGDTVISVLALALACGVEIETAVEVANVAAGIVVGKVGTAAIGAAELLAGLGDCVRAPESKEKLVTTAQLLAQVARWRGHDERIVFTNGCFDLLHAGHVNLLEKARAMGERLIVALNSDASVTQLKGTGRPLVGQAERARILAALAAVDAVVIFNAPTPLSLIEAIRPDVLVKGGDYLEEEVVGAAQVRSWGGRVELVPLFAGLSTTRIIARTAASVRHQPALPAQLA